MKKIMVLFVLLSLFSCASISELEKKVDNLSKAEFTITIPQEIDSSTKVELSNQIEKIKKALLRLEKKVDIQKITISEYKVGISKLNEEQKLSISTQLMNVAKNATIEIVGYADTKGNYKQNLILGLNRANEVKRHIESLGYYVNSVSSKGANDIKEKLDSPINRRVEIFIK